MDQHPPEQPTSKVNQSQQTVQGNQTNIAGDYHAAPTHENHTQSSSAVLYGFLFAALALVALVIVFVSSQPGSDGDADVQPSQPGQTATVSPDSAGATATASPIAVNQAPPTAAEAADCLAQYAAQFPPDNVVVFEEGLRDLSIRRNAHDRLLLRLTENQEPLGLVHLLLFPTEEQFKIEKILDAHCVEVAPEGNDSVRNWDVFSFSLQGVRYGIRLGYYSETSLRSGGLRRME